jgi:hypothetical protein
MTQEQENAEIGRIVKRYQEANRERTVLASKAQSWVRIFQNLALVLETCGEALPNINLANLPEKAEIINTQNELALLNTEIGQLRKSLKLVGINDLA